MILLTDVEFQSLVIITIELCILDWSPHSDRCNLTLVKWSRLFGHKSSLNSEPDTVYYCYWSHSMIFSIIRRAKAVQLRNSCPTMISPIQASLQYKKHWCYLPLITRLKRGHHVAKLLYSTSSFITTISSYFLRHGWQTNVLCKADGRTDVAWRECTDLATSGEHPHPPSLPGSSVTVHTLSKRETKANRWFHMSTLLLALL